MNIAYGTVYLFDNNKQIDIDSTEFKFITKSNDIKALRAKIINMFYKKYHNNDNYCIEASLYLNEIYEI